ncbi:MAG: 3-oxoacyl-[acyl-carrier protein] reductase [Gammaproteobacteria bacterium]|jgi:3-oxoacyl-[acyl-carrier protein] reductase
MGKLSGKKALITGSSSGIGAGVALAFAEEGSDVVINYPDGAQEKNALDVCEKILATGQKGLAVQADVSLEEDANTLVAEALSFLGRIDILVNNAGIAHAGVVEEIPVEMWDKMIAVHLRSIFLVTRKVIPGMYQQDYGKIINTASQLAYKGAPGFTHYTAAKGAILSFTRSLALEVGERNVNVNAVAPGATHTPILAGVPDDLLESIRQSIPKKRLAEVADIVPTYVFLASDESSHFQGQCLSPNGGDVFL